MSRFLDETGLTTFWGKIMNSITTKISKVSKTIPVNGGPLANEEMMEAFPNGIEKDADLQTVLEKIFCKDIYPTPSVSNPSISSKFNNPNLTITSGTVEVGTSVSIPTFTGYEPKYTTVSRKYTGFTNGYSLEIDGEIKQGNPPDVPVSSISINSGTYTLTRTYTLFNKSGNPTTTKTGDSSTSIESENVIVEEGTNKVMFSIDGPGFKGTVAASPEYYVVSNLSNRSEEHKIAAKNQEELSNATATRGTTTKSLTGSFKYFMGYSTNTTYDQFDSDSIRALTVKTGWVNKDSETVIQNDTVIKSNGTSIVIACPNKYKLSSITNGLGADIIGNFSSKGEINVNTGTIQTSYNVYVYPITNGAEVEMKNIKLNVK